MTPPIKPQSNKVHIKMGPFVIDMANMPKWTLILIGIGLMFMLIMFGHAFYKSSVKAAQLTSIVEKIARDKPLNDSEVKFLGKLSKPEMATVKKQVKAEEVRTDEIGNKK